MSANFDLKSLVRPNIWALHPYRCARDDFDKGILLDANENSYGSAIELEGFPKLERYPDPYQLPLKQLLADFRGVKKENIFLGVGSDEALDNIMRVFVTPGKESVLLLPPTYGMYTVLANTNDAKIVTVPLTKEFQLDLEKIKEAIANDTSIKMIFVCSPNNPTGNDLKREDVLEVIKGNPNKIVVVDEAYIDFSSLGSLAPLVETYPNLVIIQTLSKAFGLAGVRIGLAIASEEIAKIMNKVRAPYSISKLTSQVALGSLAPENIAKVLKSIELIKQERARVIAGLKEIDAVKKIFPTDSNFILFRMDHSFAVYKTVADLGVVSRYRGNEINCEECLRLTVGTPAENDEFLTKVKEVLATLK